MIINANFQAAFAVELRGPDPPTPGCVVNEGDGWLTSE
jgi:hypothetical protein